MNILITGGAGFIGSHITDRLISEGYTVSIIDNLSTGYRENINPKARFYQADIRDKTISKIFAAENPQVVIHQAARITRTDLHCNPLVLGDINIIGTINILENIMKFKVGKILYASSAAVYGDARYLPIDERHPVSPISHQGISKLTPEQYIKIYSQMHGIKYTILRYANVYGPRQNNKPEKSVVANFCDCVLLGKRPQIYGDGHQSRDFVFISDVVQANFLALTKGDDETINIGSGKETAIKELVYILNCLNGCNLKPRYQKARTNEIMHSALDNIKARFLLDWVPSYSLKEGLALTMESMRQRIQNNVSNIASR